MALLDPPRLTALSHGGGCGCKISPAVLADLLRAATPRLPLAPLLVGTETADDAAVWQLNEAQAVVATTDFFMPIVDDPFDFGRIAAANALSDVYAMGARPQFALAILAMPISKLSPEIIREVLRGGECTCAQAGIVIAGGHSIDSLEPIYGLAVIGLVHPHEVKRNSQARAGDVLILGKPLGVGILAAALKKQRLPEADYRRLLETTTTLNVAGPELARIPGVHAMTDVTGFGLLGHLLELCRGSGLSAHIRMSDVPVMDGVLSLANAGFVSGASARNWDSYGREVKLAAQLKGVYRDLLSDPQTSGGLLVACEPAAAQDALDVLAAHGCRQASVIGSMLVGAPEVSVEM